MLVVVHRERGTETEKRIVLEVFTRSSGKDAIFAHMETIFDFAYYYHEQT